MFFRLVISVGWLFAALIVHELGHVLFGCIVGCHFEQLGVGPLSLVRGASGLRTRLLPISAWGPFAVMRPVSTERVAQRIAWLAAGGPIASACVGLVVSGGVWLHLIPRWGLVFGILNLCAAVATGQPFGTGAGLPSDGRRVWDLWRRDADAHAATALIVLDAQATAGVRPAAWDPALLRRAAEITHPPAFVLAAAVANYRHVADRSGLVGAAGEIDAVRRLYTTVPRWLRGEAAVELACWYALVSGDRVTARAFLVDARGQLTPPHRRWRAAASVWLLDGNITKAAGAVAEAERSLHLPDAGATEFDRELIAMTRERLRGLTPEGPARNAEVPAAAGES